MKPQLHLWVVFCLACKINNTLTDQIAAFAVEVAGDGTDRFQQPIAQCAAATLINTGRHIQCRGARAHIAVYQIDESRCRDAGNLCLSLRCPWRYGLFQRIEVLHGSFNALMCNCIALNDLIAEGG